MKKFFLTLTLVVLFVIANGQSRDQLIEKAKECFNSKDYVNAEVVIKELINLDPKFEENYLYWANLAQTQINLGKSDEALNSVNQSLKLNKKFVNAYFVRAGIYTILNEPEKVLKDLNKALKIDPNNKKTLLELGLWYSKKGDLFKAKEYYEKILSLYPDYLPALANMSKIKKMQGDLLGALSDLNYLIGNYRDEPILYNNRADTFMKLGKYDMAFNDVNKALALNPDYITAIVTKGEIYYFTGDYENAYKWFNMALSKGFKEERLLDYISKCKEKLAL